jgi:hypothetical protein
MQRDLDADVARAVAEKTEEKTEGKNRGTDEKYTNGYVHYIAARPFLAGYASPVPGLPYFEDDPAR